MLKPLIHRSKGVNPADRVSLLILPPVFILLVSNLAIVRNIVGFIYIQKQVPSRANHFLGSFCRFQITTAQRTICNSDDIFSRNNFPVQGKAFIVTGGSLGLGRATGIELAKRGALRILLVARSAGPLAEARTAVSRAATNSAAQVDTFVADLTDAKAASEAVKAAGSADDSPVDGVFCVAGTSRPDLFASLEPEAFSTAMKLNYMTAVNVAYVR
jgi:hypothetical protein